VPCLGGSVRGCERVTPSPPPHASDAGSPEQGRGKWWWLVGSTRCIESCGTQCLSRLQLHELPTCPERCSNDESQRLSKKPLTSPHKDSPHGLTSVLPFGSMWDSLVRGSVLRLRRCLPDFFYCFFLGWGRSTRSVSDRQVDSHYD
jgi:hypothetical protein